MLNTLLNLTRLLFLAPFFLTAVSLWETASPPKRARVVSPRDVPWTRLNMPTLQGGKEGMVSNVRQVSRLLPQSIMKWIVGIIAMAIIFGLLLLKPRSKKPQNKHKQRFLYYLRHHPLWREPPQR
jgi:hypothetical protein